jgi:hypothetical protein
MKKFLIFSFLGSVLFAQINGAKYLIITHDNFYNQALTLAKWKHKKGVPAKVVKLSEIGNTYTAIKNYILNAYNSWQIRPEYVLLFGAVDYVPTHPSTYQSPSYQGHDHYYSDLGGNSLPEIAVGRLPCLNSAQAEMMVQKILSFEKDIILNPDWYIRGTTIVREDNDPTDDSIYVRDARMVRNFWIQYGYTKIDNFRRIWGNNANDVINSVNEGREFVLYRGTGVENWYSPFEVNPYSTSNGKKLPIIVSATCQTVAMRSGYEYAGEAWLRAGDVNNLKGAVSFLGTTTIITGGAYLRSAFVRGFFKKIYLDSVFILGEAFKAGKKQVLDSTGDISEVKSWQLLGDPELNIWTKAPSLFLVNYQNPIPSPFNLEINVKNLITLQPVYKAKVCITHKNDIIYLLGETDQNGKVSFNIPQLSPCTLYITVTKFNYVPWEGEIYVLNLQGPYISYYNHVIFDENGDGRINPGENVTVGIGVKNTGNQTANSVYGKVRINSDLINLIDSVAYFGDIMPDSIKFDSSAFSFYVSPSCTNGYQIPLNMIFYDIVGDTWNYNLNLFVSASHLEIIKDSISDSEPVGNGNNIWEPGETVKLFLFLKNTGIVSANNVKVVLKSLSPLLYVIDSVAYYGTIQPESTKININDPFLIKADLSVSCYEEFPCSLKITIDSYSYKKSYLIKMGIQPGVIIQTFQVPQEMPLGGWITGIAFDGTGLWIADYNNPYIYKVNPYNGNYITSIPAPGGVNVYELSFDQNSNALWVNNRGTNYIYKINLNGQIIQQFPAPAQDAGGLCFDGQYLWISEYNTNTIYKVNPSNGSIIGTYSLPYPGGGIRGTALDKLGENGGTLINVRIFLTQGNFDSTYIYEWNRTNYSPTGRKVKLNINIRGIEFVPSTGDYWVSEPHSSIRGYIHRIRGFHCYNVETQEKIKDEGKLSFKVHQNILNKDIKILLNLPSKMEIELKIFDATGREIEEIYKGRLNSGNYEFEISLKKSGVYFLVLRAEKYITYKLIKF